MRLARVLALTVAAAAFGHVLDNRYGMIPPAGKFLNPFAGFWQNGRATDERPAELRLPGLRDPVTVVWDDRQIPHVFAGNAHDLYYAQGYVVARDRLWQIDMQVRAAAGRLAEVLGTAAVPYDRSRRRLGLTWAAERTVPLLESDSISGPALAAYVAGVNARIDELGAADLPVEFKMLDYAPERFTTLGVALILKYFQYDLAFFNSDWALTESRQLFDHRTLDLLYPSRPHDPEPVIPAGTQWDFEPVLPRRPEPPPPPMFGHVPPGPRRGMPVTRTLDPVVKGSNNWAISGTRSATGKPILASDPHLPLTLPSVWFECQLAAPDLNVYGIAPAGAPGVVFGFNAHAAWGGTAAYTDVVDWYRIEFRDSTYTDYRYGQEWRPTEKREEKIRVRDGDVIFDTLVLTHHGPICRLPGEETWQQAVPPGHALRWVAHEPSNEVRTILELDRVRQWAEFERAAELLSSPGLNLAYGDVHGDIGLIHAGRYPLRWPGQGRTLLEGSHPTDEWQGWIPAGHTPRVKNPVRGFVSSANQHPTDSTYPYEIGWTWANIDRARRINESLARVESATPADMRALQTDVTDGHAASVLPVMLDLIAPDSLDADLHRTYDQLLHWDLQHAADRVAARVFSYFWWWLDRSLWADEFERDDALLEWPSRDVTEYILLQVPESPFWDNRETDSIVEDRVSIVREALRAAHRELTDEFGPIGPAWAVGRSRGTDIRHLGRVPGFGRAGLTTGGTATTINATTRGYGPSWRMVVSLTDPPEAWGILPGGSSGQPGSAYYDTDVDAWVAGVYRELLFLSGPGQVHERLIGRTIMRGRP